MRTWGTVLIGILGLYVAGAALFGGSNHAPVAPAQPAAAPPIKNDIFGPPLPPMNLKIPPVHFRPEREKDSDGFYAISIPAGLSSSASFQRFSRELRTVLVDTQDYAAAGLAIRVALYVTWASGQQDEIVQMVFPADIVRELLHNKEWMRDSAVQNIPDLADSKTVVSTPGFAALCSDIYEGAATSSHRVAGQRFCMY